MQESTSILSKVPATLRDPDRLQGLVHSKHISEKQKIAEASRQFESLMLRQILSETLKPMIQGYLEESSGSDVYRYMIIDKLADQLSAGNALGISKVIAGQVEPLTLRGNASSTPEVTPPSAPLPHTIGDVRQMARE